MESVWSVSKLSTESVGSRRELVANCVHTADADATELDTTPIHSSSYSSDTSYTKAQEHGK